MRVLALLAIAGMLSGCASEAPQATDPLLDSDGDGFVDVVEEKYGSDPHNATSLPDAHRHKDVSFTDKVTVVGTGVPGVQCPADQVNSQVVEWTIAAPDGNVSQVHAMDLVFKVQGAATVNDVDLFVSGPDGAALGSGTGSTASETVEVSGKRPVGTYTIEARGCSGVGDVDITASGTLVWLPSNEDLMHEEGIVHQH